MYIFVTTFVVALSVFFAFASGILARSSSALRGNPLHHRGQTEIHLALMHSRDDRPAVFANSRVHSYVFVCLSQLISKMKDRSCPFSVAKVLAVFVHHVE